MTKKISLIESLTGFSFNLKLLNDLEVVITTGDEQLIRHNDVMKVPNLGMHHYKNSMSNGDLYVNFEILYPQKLTNEQKEKLKDTLPKGVLPEVK